MNDKKKFKLPVLENWICFTEGKSCGGYFEYELYSDAIIIGSSESSDFGPYQFVNTAPQRNYEVRVSIILRVDYRMPNLSENLPQMNKTDTSLYHGGGITDEIASLISLAMGTRIMAGGMTRDFSPEGDRFGRPVGWSSKVVAPIIRPEYNRYVLPAVMGEKRITALTPLKNLFQLDSKEVTALVKSARLYQNALWIAENDASLAWIMLVSAIETAANYWRRSNSTPEERLKISNEDLYKYLLELGGSDAVSNVSNFIVDSLGSTKKFVDFVLNYLPPAPDNRPPEYLQHSWNKKDMEKALKRIYKYRSQALHGGTPFPWPMCEPPYHTKEFKAPAERPMGEGAYANSGTWVKEDVPMLLNTFEYIARNCLLSWWKEMNDNQIESKEEADF